MSRKQAESSLDGIAIIGMSGRFPGANNIDEFWRNLRDGKEAITFFSDEKLAVPELDFESTKDDSNYVPACGVLEDVDLFDARFFGFSPKNASILDPQQRIWLECAWEALENAGYDPERYEGSIGVFAGGSYLDSYLLHHLCKNREYIDELVCIRDSDAFSKILSNSIGFMPTRTSHIFNLKGPSVNVQTACSTSLVAVHLACQNLLCYDSDICMAGGVSIIFPQEIGYLYEQGGILSPDGHCRPFDANARGTVTGNGVGVIVLKRLEDALDDRDFILAVIRGSAINNDGSKKVSYYAPGVEGQSEVVAMAQSVAEVDPETITYIEAHGTATPLGDPVEISGLTKAFRLKTDALQFCGIGSVKSNIGHLDAAAGVAGLIKTVLALQHKEIPPSLHCENPNPEIDFENSPFFVISKLTPWETDKIPCRAGVSSFGIGGTNAHVVLEEAPIGNSSGDSRPYQLIVLSAKTDTALENKTKQLTKYLKTNPEVKLADVAFTLHVGRQDMNQRLFFVCHDLDNAASVLDSMDSRHIFKRKTDRTDPPIVFIFPEQAVQNVNMGLELYESESRYRDQVDRCSKILQSHLSIDIRDILYPDEKNVEDAGERLKQTFINQPALFIIEYALAKLWMSWGVHPEALAGRGIGEYVAACLAGVFSLEDALSVVAARGRLMQELPGGSMLEDIFSDKEIHPFFGDSAATEYIEKHPSKKNEHSSLLDTSHASYSKMMDSIVEMFTDQIKQVRLHPPQIQFFSNATGTWITPNDKMKPAHWANQLHRTVRLSDCVEELSKDPNRVFLEIGIGQTQDILERDYPKRSKERTIHYSMPHPKGQESDFAFILKTLGKLWLAGVEVDWAGFYAAEKRNRVPLPTYPFERQRYWVEPVQKRSDVPASQVGLITTEGKCHRLTRSDSNSNCQAPCKAEFKGDNLVPRNEVERFISNIWEEALGIEQVGISESFFELGGDSLLGARVVAQIRNAFGIKLLISDLFEAPTILEFALLVESRASSSIDSPNDQKKKVELKNALKLLGRI